ncbi:Cysteine proteinase 3 [Entamoeba marina]
MFLLTALFLLSHAANFESWSAHHGKRYTPAEHLRRRSVFNHNARLISKLSQTVDYELSLDGPFSAMTLSEYQSLLNAQGISRSSIPVTSRNIKSIPSSIDWRESGIVTPIRDQESCGSCYVFGAFASLESRLLLQGSERYTVDDLDLSEQQVVDCSLLSSGCNGGTMNAVFEYVIKKGVMDEISYPYVAVQSHCSYNKNAQRVTMDHFETTELSETALVEAIAEGPVSVCIDSSQSSFQFYKSGVYDEPKCSNKKLNHCVGAVGYGTTSDGDDYYIVKNSWGSSWGDEGYILMSRNKNNQCGIATSALIPFGISEI